MTGVSNSFSLKGQSLKKILVPEGVLRKKSVGRRETL
jgi:hypothetical protein